MSASTPFTPERSGVYSARSVGATGGAAMPAGTVRLEADLHAVRDKDELLQALARAIRYPGEFGNNWDALADVLQDLSWLPASVYVLRVARTASAQGALRGDWRTFLEILAESAMYWKEQGKTFVALVEDAQELPQWT